MRLDFGYRLSPPALFLKRVARSKQYNEQRSHTNIGPTNVWRSEYIMLEAAATWRSILRRP